MKRLSALFVVLVMLGISTSSYGYFLIYNLTGTIRGIIYNRADTNTMGIDDTNAVTIPFKGSLVMNLDNDTNSLIDANMIIDGKDPNGHKVYVQLNASDSNGFLNPNILERGNKRRFYVLNGKSPFDFNSFMLGTVRNTDIGLAHRKLIATTLKGAITVEDSIFLDVDHNITGVGTISASLFTLATNGVNNLNNTFPITPRTQDEIIDALKGIGIYNNKYYNHPLWDYTALSIPAP
jgi:hypothetical protein